MLGACVASIGSTIVQVEKDAANVAKKVSRKQILNIYDKMPNLIKQIHTEAVAKVAGKNSTKENGNGDNTKLLQQLAAENQIMQEENSSDGGGRLLSILKATRWILRSLSFVFLGGLLIGHFEGWHWGNSIYYSFITGTNSRKSCSIFRAVMAISFPSTQTKPSVISLRVGVLLSMFNLKTLYPLHYSSFDDRSR